MHVLKYIQMEYYDNKITLKLYMKDYVYEINSLLNRSKTKAGYF